MLALYTDGIIESRSPDGVFFDEAGVEAVLAESRGSAEDIAEATEQRVIVHCGGVAQDDMAIVTLRADD